MVLVGFFVAFCLWWSLVGGAAVRCFWWSCLVFWWSLAGWFRFSPRFGAVGPPPVHPDGVPLPSVVVPSPGRAPSRGGYGCPYCPVAPRRRRFRRSFCRPWLACRVCVCFTGRGSPPPRRVATYRSLPFGRVLGRVQYTTHLRVSLMGEPHVSYTRAFLSQSGGCTTSQLSRTNALVVETVAELCGSFRESTSG